MSLSTIITIAVAIVIIVIAVRFLSGLLKFAVGLAIFAVAAYWIYHTFFLHSAGTLLK